MTKISKQVIVDYFKTFLNQFSPLSKEQFNKIRSLVDEAECGCCNVTSIYWINDVSPSTYQLRFRDANDNILAETSLDGLGPQRFCVPRGATQLCLNVITEASGGGNFLVTGTNGFSFTDTEAVGEFCTAISFPFDDAYILSPVPPTP